MDIRILNKADAASYQELRLRALTISPKAFGSTYEKEVNYSVETITEKITPTKDKFVLGAFNGERSLTAIVAFLRETDPKTHHKGHALSLFVAPDGRKQGLGKKLMVELLNRAKNCEGLEQINLTVASENRAAKNLYLSLGFETYGIEKKSFKYDSKYYDVDFMVKDI